MTPDREQILRLWEMPSVAKSPNVIETYSDLAMTKRDYEVMSGGLGLTDAPWYPLAMMNNCTAASTLATTRSVLYFWPWIAPFNTIIDKISINVTTARTSTTGRVGLYKNFDNGQKCIGYPDTLLYQTGSTFDMTTTLVKTIADIRWLVTGGEIYWVAFVCGGGSQNPSIRSIAQASIVPIGLPTTMGATAVNGFQLSYTYAALPQVVPSGTPTNNTGGLPLIAVRYLERT